MEWFRSDRFYSDSNQGYRIVAIAGAGGDGWRYMAWGPELYSGYAELKQRHKVHYGLGEKVPQMRECLGVFPGPDEAKTACDEHWREGHDSAA